ncbi:hypothetical protein Trydic_g9652 [Trypoxylus dichotomus]
MKIFVQRGVTWFLECLVAENGVPQAGGEPGIPRSRLHSRNPPLRETKQLDASSVKERHLWDHNCQLSENLEEREWFRWYDCSTAGIELDRRLWVKLNRVRARYGGCAYLLDKWIPCCRISGLLLRVSESDN